MTSWVRGRQRINLKYSKDQAVGFICHFPKCSLSFEVERGEARLPKIYIFDNTYMFGAGFKVKQDVVEYIQLI